MNHAEFTAELRERELYNSQQTSWREQTSIKHKFWIIYHGWISPRETPPAPDGLQTDSAVAEFAPYLANEKSPSCSSEQTQLFIFPPGPSACGTSPAPSTG